MTLDSLERYDEALESFDKAIEIEPNNILTWGGRGATLGILGRYNEALESYDKVIEIDPNMALAWSSRGMVLVALKRWSKALISYNKAIELGDRSSGAFLNRSKILLALDRWDESMAALDNALERFAHADEPKPGDTAAIVRHLLIGRCDTAVWRTRIKALIDLYDKHQAISDLGQGLVRSIPRLNSRMISDTAAQTWLEIWQELAGKYDEFQIPLRLLDAAVRYREKQDPRILLRLPVEERKVLEELLGKEE